MSNYFYNTCADYGLELDPNDLHDLYLALRESYEGNERDRNGNEVRHIAARVFNEVFTKSVSSHLDRAIEEARWALDVKLGSLENEYKERIIHMENILKDQLKLFGAVALVSEDEVVRESAHKLLRENNINVYEVMQDKYGK